MVYEYIQKFTINFVEKNKRTKNVDFAEVVLCSLMCTSMHTSTSYIEYLYIFKFFSDIFSSLAVLYYIERSARIAKLKNPNQKYSEVKKQMKKLASSLCVVAMITTSIAPFHALAKDSNSSYVNDQSVQFQKNGNKLKIINDNQ